MKNEKTNVETKNEEFVEEVIDETKPEKFARTKAFFAKHKKQVVLAASGVAATVAGALVLKNKLKDQYDAGYEDGLEHLMENDSSLTAFDDEDSIEDTESTDTAEEN